MKDYDINRLQEGNKEFIDYMKTVQSETRWSDGKSFLYSFLPLRTVSRLWGWFTSIESHRHFQTKYLLKLYCKAFNVNMSEALVEDLSEYRTVSQFFRRPLKPDARPIHSDSIICPSDGKILSFGKLDSETPRINQVKGLDFSLKALLGPLPNQKIPLTDISEEQYRSLILNDKENNDLFYTVIYLAPGDYHRFHSPCDWVVDNRRYFPGALYSVNPSVAGWLKNLFALNERVTLTGKWKHGFMAYTPVGATNVGSIKVYFDEELITNLPYPHSQIHKPKHNKYLDKVYPQPVKMDKGEQLGEFNLGSTIVMVFEAPKDYTWDLEEGKVMRVGQKFMSRSVNAEV